MVLPSAGARATMRFAQRRAGPGSSNVSASGQSDVLRVATTSASVNVLIQVRVAVDVGTSLWSRPASGVEALSRIVSNLQGLCCASLPGLGCWTVLTFADMTLCSRCALLQILTTGTA